MPIRVKEQIMVNDGEEENYHGHFIPKEVPSGRYRDIWDYEQLCSKEREIRLPKGSIEKLIGRELTWGDEPVELKEE